MLVLKWLIAYRVSASVFAEATPRRVRHCSELRRAGQPNILKRPLAQTIFNRITKTGIVVKIFYAGIPISGLFKTACGGYARSRNFTS